MIVPNSKPLRDEMLQLLELQVSALEKEDFGIATMAEVIRYQCRQARIAELYNRLLANHASTASAPSTTQTAT